MTEFLNLLLPWEDAPNDQISDVFVYVIGTAFLVLGIYFLIQTFRQCHLVKNLTQELQKFNRPAQPQIKQELKEKFAHNNELAEAWQEFEDSLIIRKRNENQEVVYKTDEASIFFSEDRLLEYHLNLRFWNSVPALLVGLGILGTFVGLVWGLIPFSGINFTQTDQIQSAIKELLSGVSTAFVTSVWGMLTSLVFNWLEKWLINRVSRAIANLQRALDQLFTLTTQEEIAIQQEVELEQQTAALKSFSTDLADKIKIAMDNIMSERLENLHQGMTQLHDQNVQGIREIVQELHDAPDAFSNAVAKQLAPSLDKLNEAVERLREQKEESSTDAIRELAEEFQKFLSGSVMDQMETLAETVSKVSDSLITLPKQMEKMIGSVQEQIDQTRRLLDAISEEQNEQMKQIFGEMNEQMRAMVSNVRDLVESVTDKMEAASDQSIKTLQQAITQLQHALDSTASQTFAEFEAMTNRMRELVNDSATRLDEIFKGGEQRVNGLLQQQVEQTEAINEQLKNSQETLTEGREMLLQMDASATSVGQMIEKTKEFSEQLTTGATQLERAGQQLTEASDAFKRENEEYLRANRETTQQIQNTLDQSKQMLDDFSHRFKTIDKGLNSIFAEIEKGLNTYATTSRESINKYLSEFSEQLSSAANALAGSVVALDENVGILNDLIERRR